jgi:hypothetical protein
MSYPSGPPGAFPGPPPQQPNPGYGGPQRPPVFGPGFFTPNRILFLVVAGLSVLSLFLSFIDVQGGGCTGGYYNACYGGSSFYQGSGWVPALLAIGGALALLPILPWRNRDFGWGLIIGLVNVAVVLPILFDLFSVGGLGAGGIIVMILAILQLGAAVVAYLMEINVIRLAPKPAYAQPGGRFPQSGPFPPPGAPQQPGQPAYYNQQQPAQPGSGPVPPPPNQGAKATQFMQHPGQLSQPPGTPPSGYQS